jgi:hypothetical protein
MVGSRAQIRFFIRRPSFYHQKQMGLRLAMCAVALASTIALAVAQSTTQSPSEDILRDVEFAFREAMELFSYNQLWRLWELGTSSSRNAIKQNEFADRTGKTWKLKTIEDYKISITSQDTATVVARLRIEEARMLLQPGGVAWVETSVTRHLSFRYEDGRWRPQLWGFQ